MSNRAMEEEEKPKGFKVEDRRRFSAEGEARPEAETGPEEVRPEAEIRPDSKEAPLSGRTSAPQAKQTGGAQTQFRTEPGADRGRGEFTFATFVVSLSTQALMLLGEIPDPMTNQKSTDLPAAQQLIDILGVLQEKTRGNLDHDETGLLDSILFDLRMKYVEVARATPR
ncbi:MAG TPA: DUF1844 domain-containing protein [Candidatus Binataceae bacterium]|jgi:hypothetical protein